MPPSDHRLNRLSGCLLGTALGDSLGLPWEGLASGKIAKKLGVGPLGHRFLFRRGMVSDDTEHTLFVAQALLRAGDDPDLFQRLLARSLKGWLMTAPAGIGLATLRSCAKLLVGVHPSKSGVNSAGNGPSMRSAIIGAYFANDLDQTIAFCDRSSVITHTDERAIVGARIVAIAAQSATLQLDANQFFEQVLVISQACRDWLEMIEKLHLALDDRITVREFAESIGVRDRVSGYVMQSVPVAIYIWLSGRKNFMSSIDSAIRLGGDTDTVAAIVGALCGIEVGGSELPDQLLEGMWEWPRGVAYMRELAKQMNLNGAPPQYKWPMILPRNLIFTSTVLYHGFKRLF